MTEDFLHYIWKHSLYNQNLITDEGEKVEVIKNGEHNFHSGPDFQNAKIKIGKTIWAGNVEIHINSSDWYKHNHHNDNAYNNVILQAVYNNDKIINRYNGEKLPVIKLKFNPVIYENYCNLLNNEQWISCENKISELEKYIAVIWMESLAIERLQEKIENIAQTLSETQNSWEETFYIHIARNYGFKVNALPFEMLAKSIPLKILARHKDNLTLIESLLFGQAGFLNENCKDDYYAQIQKEYTYLQKKYSLNAIPKHMWKFMRLRPVNFPTIRISQFASLIYHSSGLFSRLMEAVTVEDLYKYFNYEISVYWNNHFVFGKQSLNKRKKMGRKSIDVILINTIIPFLFHFGKFKNRPELTERALSFLCKIGAEDNAIIRNWKRIGIEAKNALQSQSLIQLKNNYCSQKKCINCQIGSKIIVDNKTG